MVYMYKDNGVDIKEVGVQMLVGGLCGAIGEIVVQDCHRQACLHVDDNVDQSPKGYALVVANVLQSYKSWIRMMDAFNHLWTRQSSDPQSHKLP